MAKTSQSYTIGNSTVTLQIGDILDSHAKVLVSSDDNHLTMGGGVSKAIYEAGGDAIKQDAQRKAGRCDIGDVVVTTAGNISPCDYIFHGISRRKGEKPTSSTAADAERVIGQIVRNSIALLIDMKLNSIAFPALGTGYALFQPVHVAVVMAKVLREELVSRRESVEVEIYLYPANMAADVTYVEFFRRFDTESGWRGNVIRDHAVVMIHGIRTEARWYERLDKILRDFDHQLNPVSTGYEYFDIFRFLMPFEFTKKRVLQRVETKLKAVCQDPSTKKVSVVAHSFGAYLIGEILKRNKDLKLHRLILCGAVLSQEFPWEEVHERLTPIDEHNYPMQRVINDCGWRDVLPVLAQSVTWGYGSSGRLGFQSPIVKDRFHDLAHSGFFEHQFVRDYWCSAISEGRIIHRADERPPVSWLLQLLTVFKLRYVMLLAVIFAALAFVI